MITLEMFKGIAPRFAAQALPNNAAQTAIGCKFGAGALRALKNLSAAIGDVTVDVNAQTLYLNNKAAPTVDGSWLDFTTDTDIVKSPIAKDAYDRTYFANGTKPGMKVAGSATMYDLGIPVPVVSGVTVTVDGTADPSPPVALDQETRYYVITYVSAYDEEGPPSAPMGPHTWSPGQHVDLAVMPTGPGTGTTNIDRKRIYRTNTGSASTKYQLVATISAATTSYADAVASTALGVVLPSTNWDAPPNSLRGLCLHPAGFAVGFSSKTVYCSEQYLPHAWPYSYPVSSDVVGIAVFGNTILVLTNDAPLLLSGGSPDNLYAEKTEFSYGCTSKRGIVDMGSTILFPSHEGLAAIGMSGEPAILTEAIMTKTEWATYNSATLVAAQWEGNYIAFNGTSGFIFNPENKDFVTIAIDAEALYFDQASGLLGVKLDNETTIKLFAGSADNLSYTWKSKVFRLDQPRNFGAAQVFADSYTALTFKVYAAGTLVHTQTVTSSTPFRLPSGFLADLWEFELLGTDNVNVVHIAETMIGLRPMA